MNHNIILRTWFATTMIDSEKSLEEILNALFEKVDDLDELKDKEELERLKSEPGFRRLVEVLLEEGQRRDKEVKSEKSFTKNQQ